jgi:cell division protein FtsI (penicillin-binding protein 3)
MVSLYLLGFYAYLMIKGDTSLVSAKIPAFAERGSILDRNGRFLAIQTTRANISIWKPSINIKNVKKYQEFIDDLVPILEMSPELIEQRIADSSTDIIYIKRGVENTTIKQINAKLEEGRLRGVRVEPIVGRIYPEKTLASQIVGFVGDENKGLDGIEYAFNTELAGIENDGKGSQVVLTIDINVQRILERIAEKSMKDTSAEAVMFLAADPRNGEILGSASLPNFDPNNIRTSNDMNRMNRPVIWAYEPGSVFKIFSMAAILDSGAVSSNSVFTCNGSYVTAHDELINCLGVHGRVTVRDIITNSCNAGAAYASDHINANTFYELISDYGFGYRTGAGSPGETAGYLVPSDRWSNRSKPTLAIGQEIAVSAYQMLQAASVIANDGVLVPPRIVARVVAPDGIALVPEKTGSKRIMKAETAAMMRSYMVDAASIGIGTGWRASVEDLSLGVKTGTAQLIDPITRKYSNTDYIASCMALLPSDKPSLALYLVIIKPKGEIFGGRIAAPLIREAAESLIDYLGIPRGRNPQVVHSSIIDIHPTTLPAIHNRVPDFTGIAKRVLLPLYDREDINVIIKGDGWVRRQYPPPDTPVTDGMQIILELE